MKKLLFVMCFIAIMGCSMEKKAVVGEKCSRCGKVLAADTTLVYGKYTKNRKGQLIFTNNKDKRDAYIVNNKNNNIITRYNYELCEDCKKAKMDSFFVVGKKEYRSGNYYTAIGHFREAKKLGNEEVSHWIKKAKKKEAEAKKREAEIERREERKRERERIARENRKWSEARKEYGRQIKKAYWDRGINMGVRVHGPDNKYITLTYWVFKEDASAYGGSYGFLSDGSVIRKFKNARFEKFYYTDGNSYIGYIDLTKY